MDLRMQHIMSILEDYIQGINFPFSSLHPEKRAILFRERVFNDFSYVFVCSQKRERERLLEKNTFELAWISRACIN